MRIIKQLCTVLLLALLSCQAAVAQPNPSISKKYSDTEIDKMISSYNMAHNRDVVPSVDLKQQFQKDFPNAKDIDW